MVIHNVEAHISPTKYGKCGKYGKPTQILILHSTLSHSPTNLYNINPLLYQIVPLSLIFLPICHPKPLLEDTFWRGKHVLKRKIGQAKTFCPNILRRFTQLGYKEPLHHYLYLHYHCLCLKIQMTPLLQTPQSN